MSTEQDGKRSLAALTSALEARGNPRDVIVHSDRGGIYGGDEYVKKAKGQRLRRSMSRTRNPWDNAVIESFFSKPPTSSSTASATATPTVRSGGTRPSET